MGFKFRQQIGPKGFKINIGRNGINSTSVKIAPGITHNSKRGTTIGIPGTGLSYNTGGGRSRNSTTQNTEGQHQGQSSASQEYSRGWREFTGGYNRKAMIAVGISIVLCVTPLWWLGLLASIPSLLWFIVDTLSKIFKYKKHLSNNA